jgi:retron-type reverse transcriptase
VNHGLLIKMVRETVKDEAVIGLIKKFLKSGIMADGIVSRRELGLKSAGMPQGGNLSPLLSNIYLTSDFSPRLTGCLKSGDIRLSGTPMTATSTSRAGGPPKE